METSFELLESKTRNAKNVICNLGANVLKYEVINFHKDLIIGEITLNEGEIVSYKMCNALMNISSFSICARENNIVIMII